MLRPIRAYLPYALVLGFALWCLYCIRGDLVQVSPAALLRSWDLVALAALLSLVSYTLRIFRWRTYLARLGHKVALRFAALTFVAGFAYTLSPGKIGELVRARYYVPLGIPLRNTTAAFLVERLMDLVAMLLLAALIFTGSSRYTAALLAAALFVLLVLVCLALAPWATLERTLRSASYLGAKLRRLAAGFAASLAITRILLRPAMLAWGLLLSLLAWGFEGLGLALLALMFPEAHLDLATALGIYGVAVLLGSLSFLPGGLGGTEAVMTALLAAHGMKVSEALVVTLILRLVTLWLAVAIGWLALFLLRQRRAPTVVLPWP
jgi:uncharacterized protein (TIRG00374 family)